MPSKQKNKSGDDEKHHSLLLPREMFKTERAQLVVSILMLIILIIQVYLFISIYRMIEQLSELL